MRDLPDVDLRLPDADGLDEDDVEARGVEDARELARGAREAAERSASRDGPDSVCFGASRSARKARELRFCTSWPDVPRTAESEETRQTVSVPRCSAARRSSSASA